MGKVFTFRNIAITFFLCSIFLLSSSSTGVCQSRIDSVRLDLINIPVALYYNWDEPGHSRTTRDSLLKSFHKFYTVTSFQEKGDSLTLLDSPFVKINVVINSSENIIRSISFFRPRFDTSTFSNLPFFESGNRITFEKKGALVNSYINYFSDTKFEEYGEIFISTIYYLLPCCFTDSSEIHLTLYGSIPHSSVSNKTPLNSDLSVTPNPASSKIFITCDQSQKGEIYIYNILGQVLKRIKSDMMASSISVDIYNLPNGYYGITFGKQSGHFIVNKW